MTRTLADSEQPKETIMSTKQAFAPVAHALSNLAGHIIATSRRHHTERTMSGFSNRELADMGFERDWDGSIQRLSTNR
jgi:hypothetical protein